MVKKTYVPTSQVNRQNMNGDYTAVDETTANDADYLYNTNVTANGFLEVNFAYSSFYSSYCRTIQGVMRSRKTGGLTSKTVSSTIYTGSQYNLNIFTATTSWQTNTSGAVGPLNTSAIAVFNIIHSPAPIGYEIRTSMYYIIVYFDWKHKFFGQTTRTLRPFGKQLKNIAKVQGVE